MRHRDELDVERSEGKTAAERHNGDGHVRSTRFAFALCRQQCGCEWCGENGHFEAGPKFEQRAEMILMRMGEHEAEQVAPLLDEITDVRQNEIDAGQIIAGESDTEVDRDPLPLARWAKSINGDIHSYLAGTSERRKNK